MWDTSDQSVLIGGLKSYEYGQLVSVPCCANLHANPNHPIPNHINNQIPPTQHPTVPVIQQHVHSHPSQHQPVNISFGNHFLPSSKYDTYHKPDISLKPLPDAKRLINNQNEKRFPCRFCPQTFSRMPYLKRHERKHTGERIISCQICLKSFRDNGYFKRHMDSHSIENKYRCERGCGMTFKSYNGWRKHTNKSGDECPKRRAPTVKSTKTINIKERIFVCGLENCEKSYKTKAELVSHQRRHTGEKPFQCLICQVRYSRNCSFFTKRGLKVHILREHSVNGIYIDEKGQTVVLRNFKCEVCEKSFYFSGDLKKHLFIHENKKPYICTYCGKSFNKSNTLKWHLNLHTGAKPYKCKTCSRAFSAKANLNTHEKTHEKDRPRLFQCTECDKSFMTNRSLRIHRIGHSKDKPFNCVECKRGFNQRSHFKDHMRMHANELKFKCKKCPKAYNVKSRLKKHILYNHPQYSSDDEVSKQKEPITQTTNEDSDVDCPDDPPVEIDLDAEVEKEGETALEPNPQAVPVITRNETNNHRDPAFYPLTHSSFTEPPNPSIAVPVPPNQQACSYSEEPVSRHTFISVGPFNVNNVQQTPIIGQNTNSLHNQTSQNQFTNVPGPNMCNLERLNNRLEMGESSNRHPVQNEFGSSINMRESNVSNSRDKVQEAPQPLTNQAVPEATSSSSLYVVTMRSYTERPAEVIESLKKATQIDVSLIDRDGESSDADALSDNPVFIDSSRKPKDGVQRPFNKYNMKRFFCSECNRGFSRTSSLKRHERTHTGERPFTCESCGKGFNDKSHYKTHQFTHSREKKFACDKCDRKFKSYGGYRTHINNDVCSKPVKRDQEDNRSSNRKRAKRECKRNEIESESTETDGEYRDESDSKRVKPDIVKCARKTGSQPLNNQTNSQQNTHHKTPSNVPTRRSLRNRDTSNIVYFSDSAPEFNE